MLSECWRSRRVLPIRGQTCCGVGTTGAQVIAICLEERAAAARHMRKSE